jgi:membrane-bound serine protease (ClpP class)
MNKTGKAPFDWHLCLIYYFHVVSGDIMKKSILSVIILLFLSVVCTAADDVIRVISINGPVNPVTAGYVVRNLKAAAQHHEQFLVIEMDTPGGLDTSMREIIKEIFVSPVPVVVLGFTSRRQGCLAGR